MLVYAIRHGECESNLKGYFSPTTGNPLTEKGFEDARKTGRLLKNIHFDKIYASTYIRAQQTAKTAIPRCTPVIDERLRECDYGTMAMKSRKECLETLGSEFRHNWEIRDYSPYGGESTPDQIARVRSFMHDLESFDPDSTVAVFCHEGTIKSMLSIVLDCDYLFRHAVLGNGSVSVFEYKGNLWRIKQWGVTENDL